MRSTAITRCYNASNFASTLATLPNRTPTHTTTTNTNSGKDRYYGDSSHASTLATAGWWA